jgi:hypothetical protein
VYKRERERDREKKQREQKVNTHFFLQKKSPRTKNKIKNKKNVLLGGHRAGVTCGPVRRVRL